MRSALFQIATVALLATGLSAQTTVQPQSAALPSDAQVRNFLVDRIDVQHKSLGMVVGIVTSEGTRIVSYGRARDGDPKPPDGDTVFEIGSVTKIFTALALADMWKRGDLTPDDPVTDFLAAEVKLPKRGGRTITLADLATQTSGLPFFPTDFPVNDPAASAK